MNVAPAARLWEEALSELQLQVSRPNFETWLRGTAALCYQDGLFEVGVANDFAREWLTAKLRPLVAQTLSRLAGHPVEVVFRLAARPPAKGGPALAEETPVQPNGASSPPILRPPLYQRYTFERFVVGSGTHLAHAAALAVANSPGAVYNPLFIYGGVGMGKTHLLHAIGHCALQNHRSVLYLTSEQFTNEFVAAIAQAKMEEFRRKHRRVQVLLIDDLQFLAGKERTQEEFFYTFNDLHAAGSQIVITSDRPPRHISLLEDRLRSRCEWGLIADIQPPDLETRLAILRANASEMGLVIPNEVTLFLAQRAPDSIRELEGLLNRVTAYARLVRAAAMDLKVAREALAALSAQEARPRPTPEAIIEAVASYFHLSVEAMLSKGRQKHLAQARHVAMFLLQREAEQSLAHIGRLLGQRDHTTIRHGVQKVEAALSTDPQLQRHLSRIRSALYHP